MEMHSLPMILTAGSINLIITTPKSPNVSSQEWKQIYLVIAAILALSRCKLSKQQNSAMKRSFDL